jgi:hypothetical protein
MRISGSTTDSIDRNKIQRSLSHIKAWYRPDIDVFTNIFFFYKYLFDLKYFAILQDSCKTVRRWGRNDNSG